MTLTFAQIALYSGALLVLFLTPGPVWLALLARAMSGGFAAAWPLALGVTVGDMIWPALAILGVSWLVQEFSYFLVVLRWVAVAMFIGMGILLIRHADHKISSDSRLTRPGMWAGFVAGLIVIIGNPKAILFYMGILPGFFPIATMTWIDIAIVSLISAIIPFTGNIILSAFVDRIRTFVQSRGKLARLNRIAGGLMIFVGLVIAVT
ncbi:MAG: LysE family translocator [Thioclava marina]|jgi:Putative threonine efflux protein|uniref:Lysine transporter LysE n=1 Tax=Thioclava marina TaxID=1915077 RepID=A0ABX3MQC4_9RHOB|nr:MULTISPECIES: LysE family translocator [Thioclava]MBC7146478.1 LysE family translocator [Thioclava marina]MBD3801864.1 LysE family translocator [Thioclava sp.]OOY13754.1 lysine transporter LysE [Thioclava marina]TNF11695.1 MAG: LysE family translocator [Paracoccaceae bacterium]